MASGNGYVAVSNERVRQIDFGNIVDNSKQFAESIRKSVANIDELQLISMTAVLHQCMVMMKQTTYVPPMMNKVERQIWEDFGKESEDQEEDVPSGHKARFAGVPIDIDINSLANKTYAKFVTGFMKVVSEALAPVPVVKDPGMQLCVVMPNVNVGVTSQQKMIFNQMLHLLPQKSASSTIPKRKRDFGDGGTVGSLSQKTPPRKADKNEEGRSTHRIRLRIVKDRKMRQLFDVASRDGEDESGDEEGGSRPFRFESKVIQPLSEGFKYPKNFALYEVPGPCSDPIYAPGAGDDVDDIDYSSEPDSDWSPPSDPGGGDDGGDDHDDSELDGWGKFDELTDESPFEFTCDIGDSVEVDGWTGGVAELSEEDYEEQRADDHVPEEYTPFKEDSSGPEMGHLEMSVSCTEDGVDVVWTGPEYVSLDDLGIEGVFRPTIPVILDTGDHEEVDIGEDLKEFFTRPDRPYVHVVYVGDDNELSWADGNRFCKIDYLCQQVEENNNGNCLTIQVTSLAQLVDVCQQAHEQGLTDFGISLTDHGWFSDDDEIVIFNNDVGVGSGLDPDNPSIWNILPKMLNDAGLGSDCYVTLNCNFCGSGGMQLTADAYDCNTVIITASQDRHERGIDLPSYKSVPGEDYVDPSTGYVTTPYIQVERIRPFDATHVIGYDDNIIARSSEAISDAQNHLDGQTYTFFLDSCSSTCSVNSVADGYGWNDVTLFTVQPTELRRDLTDEEKNEYLNIIGSGYVPVIPSDETTAINGLTVAGRAVTWTEYFEYYHEVTGQWHDLDIFHQDEISQPTIAPGETYGAMSWEINMRDKIGPAYEQRCGEKLPSTDFVPKPNEEIAENTTPDNAGEEGTSENDQAIEEGN